MFCKGCGKQINSYELCGSEVSAPAKPDHFDQKSGEQIYLVVAHILHGFRCEKWGHDTSPVDVSDRSLKRRSITMDYERGSDYVEYHVPKSALMGDRLTVGPCQTKCCPKCGDAAPKKKEGGGCFIATAAYDSPLAPEVMALRQFRDEVLLQTKAGQILVALYYRISPPLARAISKSRAMKKMVRNYVMEPIIRVLTKSASKI